MNSYLSKRRLTVHECGLSPDLRGHLPGKGFPCVAYRITLAPQYLHIYSIRLVGI